MTLLSIVTLLYVFLAIYVVLNNPRKATNISFAVFLIGTAFWSLSNALFVSAPTKDNMYFWAVFAYPMTTLLLVALSLFSYYVTERNKSSFGKYLFYAITLYSFAIVYIPNAVLIDVDFKNKSIITGNLLPTLFATYIYFMGTVLKNFIIALRESTGNKKVQIRLVTIGILAGMIIATTTNLVGPALNNFDFVTVGPSFTLIFLTLVTYTIIRYKLLDVRFLIGKIIYYSFQALILYIGFYFFIWLYTVLFGSVYALESFILAIPVAYFFVAIYASFTSLIRNYTDTRLINPGYNPLEVLEQFNKKVSVMLDVDKIGTATQELIGKTVRPEGISIIIIPEDNSKEWILNNYREGKNFEPKDFQLAINIWSSTDHKPIILDELDLEKNLRFRYIPHLIEEIEARMKQYSIKVIFPIVSNERIAGMLMLGQKEADAPYTGQELNFLDSITRNVSLAINRSLLYEEIQSFNVELQRQVEDATSELKEKNKKLEEALLNLEEIRRQERDMIDVMGHELRTPISIVRNAIVVLQNKFKNKGDVDKDTLAKYLDMAVESVRREITLIETLLSATKVEGNRIQLSLNKVDLRDVINDAIEALKGSADEKNLPIETHFPDGDFFVYADRVRTQEIMDNFLSNAIKYTPEGKVEIHLFKDEKFAGVSVKDSGVGISQKDIRNLGKKFFRAQPQYSAQQGARPSGTGLGLYVTFELIDVMSGQKDIQSEIGKGSTFTFKLPLYKNQEDQEIDQTFMTDPKLAKKTIDSKKDVNLLLNREIEHDYVSKINKASAQVYPELKTVGSEGKEVPLDK